jgi:hypothetical protein
VLTILERPRRRKRLLEDMADNTSTSHNSRVVPNPSVTAICRTSRPCKKVLGQDLGFEHEVPAKITVGVLALFDRDAALEQNLSMVWQSYSFRLVSIIVLVIPSAPGCVPC